MCHGESGNSLSLSPAWETSEAQRAGWLGGEGRGTNAVADSEGGIWMTILGA